MITGTWDEVMQVGMPEIKAMLLAHGIILGIAVFRYLIKPRLTGRTPRPDDGAGDRRP